MKKINRLEVIIALKELFPEHIAIAGEIKEIIFFNQDDVINENGDTIQIQDYINSQLNSNKFIRIGKYNILVDQIKLIKMSILDNNTDEIIKQNELALSKLRETIKNQ